MKYLYLYKNIMPVDPKTGEPQGMKKPNLETISFICTITFISMLTIWAVWMYLR